MNSHNASTLQRSAAPIFDEVEAVGSVKIISKTRDEMVLMTKAQLDKLLSSKTQRSVFSELHA